MQLNFQAIPHILFLHLGLATIGLGDMKINKCNHLKLFSIATETRTFASSLNGLLSIFVSSPRRTALSSSSSRLRCKINARALPKIGPLLRLSQPFPLILLTLILESKVCLETNPTGVHRQHYRTLWNSQSGIEDAYARRAQGHINPVMDTIILIGRKWSICFYVPHFGPFPK